MGRFAYAFIEAYVDEYPFSIPSLIISILYLQYACVFLQMPGDLHGLMYNAVEKVATNANVFMEQRLNQT